MNDKDSLEYFSPLQLNRRAFFAKAGIGIGLAALSSLLPGCKGAREEEHNSKLKLPHHVARAKRVIYLFQYVLRSD